MVVKTSERALSWNDNVCACTLTFLCPIHYVNSDLCCHFLIDGYGIFPSLHCNISYTRTISAYGFWIYFSFSFVFTLYPVLYPTISILDLILCPSVSMSNSNSSLFEITLTTFPTRSLVEGGSICRVYMWFHPMITPRYFVNRAPCRTFVKNMWASVLCCSMQLAFYSFQACP